MATRARKGRAAPKAKRAVGLVFLMEDVVLVDRKVERRANQRTRARKDTKVRTKASSTKEKDMVVATATTHAEFAANKVIGVMNAP